MKKSHQKLLMSAAAATLLVGCTPDFSLIDMLTYPTNNTYQNSTYQNTAYQNTAYQQNVYNQRVTGIWAGTCFNESVRMGGTVRMTMTSSGNLVKGSMSVGGGRLQGGGAINGTISGDAITFTTPGVNPGVERYIVWTGRVDSGTMVGTFRTEPYPGQRMQTGRFRLTILK